MCARVCCIADLPPLKVFQALPVPLCRILLRLHSAYEGERV
jgi:hypothetical protein